MELGWCRTERPKVFSGGYFAGSRIPLPKRYGETDCLQNSRANSAKKDASHLSLAHFRPRRRLSLRLNALLSRRVHTRHTWIGCLLGAETVPCMECVGVCEPFRPDHGLAAAFAAAAAKFAQHRRGGCRCATVSVSFPSALLMSRRRSRRLSKRRAFLGCAATAAAASQAP